LRRLSTMSTLLCTLPRLSPAGRCSVINLLYPISSLSRTSRRSSPVHTPAAAAINDDDDDDDDGEDK